MSFRVAVKGRAKDVEAQLEREGEVAKHGRNGFEQKAIDLGVALGVAAMKHASIDQKNGDVVVSGHYDEAGIGGFTVAVAISQPVEE